MPDAQKDICDHNCWGFQLMFRCCQDLHLPIPFQSEALLLTAGFPLKQMSLYHTGHEYFHYIEIHEYYCLYYNFYYEY